MFAPLVSSAIAPRACRGAAPLTPAQPPPQPPPPAPPRPPPAVYRGGLFIASASNVPPITSGVWLVNPTFAPPTAPVASPGTLLATAPYPYGLVILDDFTFVVADQVAGLLVFRSNLTLPGANVALSSWEQPWFLAGQAMDPAVPTNGFSHVGVDTSSGGTGLAGSRVYATTYKESTDNTLVARVYRVNVTVSAAAPAVAAVALTAFASSPPGYEYRGLAGAPRCVPLPAPTPFPTPGPAPPTPSGRPSSGAGAAPAAAVAAALATGAAVVATAAVAARREW